LGNEIFRSLGRRFSKKPMGDFRVFKMGISFKGWKKGDKIAIIGSNGAGKTTLLIGFKRSQVRPQICWNYLSWGTTTLPTYIIFRL